MVQGQCFGSQQVKLEYSERQTKTRTGAEPRNIRAVKPKAYSFANGSPDRNSVFVFKFNSEKTPSSMTDSDSPVLSWY